MYQGPLLLTEISWTHIMNKPLLHRPKSPIDETVTHRSSIVVAIVINNITASNIIYRGYTHSRFISSVKYILIYGFDVKVRYRLYIWLAKVLLVSTSKFSKSCSPTCIRGWLLMHASKPNHRHIWLIEAELTLPLIAGKLALITFPVLEWWLRLGKLIAKLDIGSLFDMLKNRLFEIIDIHTYSNLRVNWMSCLKFSQSQSKKINHQWYWIILIIIK